MKNAEIMQLIDAHLDESLRASKNGLVDSVWHEFLTLFIKPKSESTHRRLWSCYAGKAYAYMFRSLFNKYERTHTPEGMVCKSRECV